MTYENILYEKLGPVARVTMNRPRYRNAQSRQLLRDLDAAIAVAVYDTDVRVIVMAAAGKDFSAGHDLGTPEMVEDTKAHPRRGSTEAERSFDYSWEHFLDMSLRWRDLSKPTIAQVHGWCIFGGWLIASAMDLVVASDDARFLTALLQYFTLPWDMGPRKAKEILFDNRVIGATEAQALGFVNKVFPRTSLEERTLELANRIASNGSFFLRMAKLSVNNMQDAAGFKASVHAAHSHYMLSEIHARLLGAQFEGLPASARKLAGVEQLVQEAEKGQG